MPTAQDVTRRWARALMVIISMGRRHLTDPVLDLANRVSPHAEAIP
jgi:hypothetical protein